MSTKIHLALCAGSVKAACLSAGQRTDMNVFPSLWKQANGSNIEYVIADKGYDFAAVRNGIRQLGKKPVIPRRKGAVCPGVLPHHPSLYKTRVAIEHFFGRLKENKRMALRFDKLDHSFFSLLSLA